MKPIRIALVSLVLIGMALASSCGGSDSSSESKSSGNFSTKSSEKAIDPMQDPGIGPIKELVLPAEIDQVLADEGKVIYKEMCTACHKADKKYIGPSPMGIFERRNPAWVMNMILNPEEMVLKDPQAKKLLVAYNGSPMANQNLTEEQARAVVEYFRTL